MYVANNFADAGVACDTGEVAVADNDRAVGKFGVVHAIGEERFQ